jgi:hypothetical protein
MTFRRTDGRDLPFPDRSFDFAHSSAVIEHVGWRARLWAGRNNDLARGENPTLDMPAAKFQQEPGHPLAARGKEVPIVSLF